jgi:hypothetical protein
MNHDDTVRTDSGTRRAHVDSCPARFESLGSFLIRVIRAIRGAFLAFALEDVARRLSELEIKVAALSGRPGLHKD